MGLSRRSGLRSSGCRTWPAASTRNSFFFRFLAETGLLGTVPTVRMGSRGVACTDWTVCSVHARIWVVTGLWAGTFAYFLHMCMDVDYVYAAAPVTLFFCLALLSTRVRNV